MFTIRTLCAGDLPVLRDRDGWPPPRIPLSPVNTVIVAVAPDGRLAGYCGFTCASEPLWCEATIEALKSRVPGAGAALLDALKRRTDRLIWDTQDERNR